MDALFYCPRMPRLFVLSCLYCFPCGGFLSRFWAILEQSYRLLVGVVLSVNLPLGQDIL